MPGTRSLRRIAAVALGAVVLAACGDTPLLSMGDRSSGWINEPQVVTTTLPPTTVPVVKDASALQWANDDILSLNLDDAAALVTEVFQRREGDRFIQASRDEIAVVLPGIQFPSVVPYGAEWVSSQLVIENSGELSTNPSAAFGIWSTEPYTRSRSVAQMITMTVSNDAATAAAVAEAPDDFSCAAFADQTTTECDVVDLADRPTWRLRSNRGETFVWFDEVRRYELFGRSFVPDAAMMRTVSELMALDRLEPDGD